MNYKSFNLGDWIGHISGIIEDETTLDGNEMRDLVEFLSTLKQEPCDDCVSRQEVEKITWEESSYSDALNVLTEVRDKVRALPSVTPTKCIATVKFSKDDMRELIDEKMKEIVVERKKGKWIKSNIGGAKVCSVCNAHMGLSNFKYCPNCGVEMESEE